MNINELTIGQARELAALLNTNVATVASHPFTIGANYFIRTVTHHFTGKLLQVFPTELVLVDGAWIADDGRLSDALRKGEFTEVEPFPDDQQIIIGRGSIIDAQIFAHKLPRSQK